MILWRSNLLLFPRLFQYSWPCQDKCTLRTNILPLACVILSLTVSSELILTFFLPLFILSKRLLVSLFFSYNLSTLRHTPSIKGPPCPILLTSNSQQAGCCRVTYGLTCLPQNTFFFSSPLLLPIVCTCLALSFRLFNSFLLHDPSFCHPEELPRTMAISHRSCRSVTTPHMHAPWMAMFAMTCERPQREARGLFLGRARWPKVVLRVDKECVCILSICTEQLGELKLTWKGQNSIGNLKGTDETPMSYRVCMQDISCSKKNRKMNTHTISDHSLQLGCVACEDGVQDTGNGSENLGRFVRSFL